MAEIIKALQKNHYYGAGKFTEIAKGKNELDYRWSTVKRKTQRAWLSLKK